VLGKTRIYRAITGRRRLTNPNSFRGSRWCDLTCAGAKTFNIGERVKVQLLAEMFNLFNRQNTCNNVDNTFYASDGSPSTTFGTPNGYCGEQWPGATFWKCVPDTTGIPGAVLAGEI
jgi:hypothetical protein